MDAKPLTKQELERQARLAVEAITTIVGTTEARRIFAEALAELPKPSRKGRRLLPDRDALILKMYQCPRPRQLTVRELARFINEDCEELGWFDLTFGWDKIADPEMRVQAIDKHIRRLLKADGIKGARGRPKRR